MAMTLLFLAACETTPSDTAAINDVVDTADTAGDPGTAPTITAMEVLWQVFGESDEIVMYADATVTDAEGDLVGGVASFDVATGSGQPIGFDVEIKDCADVSGACWIDPHLIIAIPDVITEYDYTVELVVIDLAGNASAMMAGALEGG